MTKSMNFSNKKAFTLAELIMVLIILSTVIFIVTPKVSDFLLLNARLKSGARKIAVLVRYTRSEALSTGKKQSLCFDIDKNVCRVVNSGEKVFLHSSAKIQDVMLEKNKKITSGEVNIDFSPKGYSKKVMVHLKSDKKDEVITLSVRPLTGAVSMEEGYIDW